MISIIIPTLTLKRSTNLRKFYKPKITLAENLDCIAQNNEQDVEIIVICNNPHEKQLRDLVTNHPRVDKYTINSVNIGVSRSWNQGAQLAEGEYLFFLNDDCKFGPGDLSLLRDHLMEEHVAVVGPQGIRWDIGNPLEHFFDLNQAMEVDTINGFAFMVKAEIFHQLGGFDINYTPAFFEETDFCFRVRKAGYLVMAVPKTKIRHFQDHGVSSRHSVIEYLNKRIDSRELTIRNQKYFIKKWFPEKYDQFVREKKI